MFFPKTHKQWAKHCDKNRFTILRFSRFPRFSQFHRFLLKYTIFVCREKPFHNKGILRPWNLDLRVNRYTVFMDADGLLNMPDLRSYDPLFPSFEKGVWHDNKSLAVFIVMNGIWKFQVLLVVLNHEARYRKLSQFFVLWLNYRPFDYKIFWHFNIQSIS